MQKTKNNKTIYWKDALKQLDKIGKKTVDFRGETINWRDAMTFGRAGIHVPLELVDNEYHTINLTDEIYLTEEAIKKGEFSAAKEIPLLLDKKNYDFVVKHDIDLFTLVNAMIEKMIAEHEEQNQTLKKAV